ncbi:MAG: energy-coupling factor transporter transmembrane component T family protein [Intrasporangium sp.]|uniref:energy-coupling factor transporter transmembrane component T family protein n=1 Tax=Intrasporangium sp. TaxID=1925024 RepID=UPI003F7EC3D1
MSRGDGLFGSYVTGTSVVHRAPLAAKFLVLLGVGVTTALLPDWRAACVLLALVLLCHVLAGLGGRRMLRTLRPVLPVLVVLFGFQWWSQDAAIAGRLVLGIVACYLAAGIVTGTTSAGALIDAVVTLARPVRRWLDPESVGIAVAVMFRSIPWIAGAFGEVREAARARGLERNPRALVLPVVIHTVGYARATGEALAARGLGDPVDGTEALPGGGGHPPPPGAPSTNDGAPG